MEVRRGGCARTRLRALGCCVCIAATLRQPLGLRSSPGHGQLLEMALGLLERPEHSAVC